ncbi:protein ARMCX6 [Canis lupus baileyi]|uniref:Armadillo repeat-containing domain-containing protein n=3 Tax=Canis lupus TaxID=9612 RepID=A0A8C0MXE1_CANLF|nr:protein ARMCX6 [Canis lupus dingo]XP_025287463.1 protein ARMCX6 [Canis lupus dingo]XP_025287464.1 protein ARMCX6 [Canis lupus dingo]XP_025287465.1 protein ARMCX6 [Canis lupus dingo]XP_038304942.1 protein ARMCX6-like [Canis lupus familiaris]XP_038304943.1 protein ARMCX6-like [Canis lupus familiaris]XP_038304944.1 protein ARMCX6-like [Canis lupus familiaris]XP_038304945.1 protein ARMCX6-like [Canis lupus familiaris]XP_038443815.1 protein ARMCX6-like [Canis lupus familiaris]XP_038443816.1 |eukprot:XP_003435660.1 protein ARMCX6 [Canis lupus familiaris]
MGRAREVGWMAAGLMIGAGACYCVYKLTIGRDDSDKSEEEEEEWDDDQELDEEEPDLWFDFTTMARPWSEDGDWTEPGAPGGTEDRPSGGGKANRTYPVKQRPFPYEHKNTWSTQSFRNFSCILDLSRHPFIQGKMWFAQLKDAGFSFSHDINSHLASLPIVGNTILTPHPAIKEKALCALDNLNASVENQGQIKMYVNEVCRETVSHCCNSFLQQAGLNLLISMTVINNMLAKPISDVKFPLISEGSECAEVQVLKLLIGLSEKPVLAGELLGAQMLLSFTSLFIRNANRQVLPQTLAS